MMKKIPSHWLALADQVFVSGSNFLIGIVLARVFGVQLFGLYVIAITYLMYANTFQSSLVVSPMMTAIPHELDPIQQKKLVSGFLCYALILSMLCVLGVALIAHSLGAFVPTLQLGASATPLLLAVVGFQLQDWLRRALYALQKTESVLLLDLIAYGGQLLSVGMLYLKGILTPESALISMASIFSIAAILILFAHKMLPSLRQGALVAKTYWRGSRDFFIAWQLQWLGSQGLSLFGAGVLGPQIIGALKATMNLCNPVNVLFQWMENVVPVRAVAHLKKGGLPAMHGFLFQLGWIGGLFFGFVVVLLYFYAEPLIGFVYGKQYQPYAYLAVLQALYLMLNHFYRLEQFATRARNKTSEIAKSSLILAVIAIASGVIGIHWIGGAAIILALILGQAASHLYLIYLRKVL